MAEHVCENSLISVVCIQKKLLWLLARDLQSTSSIALLREDISSQWIESDLNSLGRC